MEQRVAAGHVASAVRKLEQTGNTAKQKTSRPVRAEVLAEQLRVVSLAKDPGSIPIIHKVAHNCLPLQSQGLGYPPDL